MNTITSLTIERMKHIKNKNCVMASVVQAKINRLIEERENRPLTIKELFGKMSDNDEQRVNHFLNKIPILADLLDSTTTDLISIIKKIDPNYNIPVFDYVKEIKRLSKTFFNLVNEIGQYD